MGNYLYEAGRRLVLRHLNESDEERCVRSVSYHLSYPRDGGPTTCRCPLNCDHDVEDTLCRRLEETSGVDAVADTAVSLTFEQLARVNVDRARAWHPGFPDGSDGWTGADWSNALCGEAGEMANVVKKIRRLDTGITQADVQTGSGLLWALRKEIGDVIIYADLLAQFYGMTLEECVRHAFNVTSVREGLPQRLGAPAPGTEAGS